MKNIKKNYILIVTILFFLLGVGLRLYKLDTLLPPYWEEVALGYDAFSISETLRDHHGNFLPLVAFESFGDWKPSLYFYAIVPFIKIFGLGVLAVRLPSFLAGVSVMLGVYFLIKTLAPKEVLKNTPYLPTIGLAVTAISPWAIMFSRSGWEVNLATALVLWGVIAFLSFLKSGQKLIYLLTSIILLVLSMYAYHATRLIAPIIGASLVVIWFFGHKSGNKITTRIRNFVLDNGNKILLAGFVSIFLVLPILQNLTNPTTTQRFAETSIFSHISIIEESNMAKELQPNIIGRVFYHRYLIFAREIAGNFASHFTIDFLFISGDNNPRHSSQYLGQLYHIEFIFLLLGIYFIATRLKNDKSGLFYFLIFWLIIGIIPASISTASPHALRILPTLPVFMTLITFGIYIFVTGLRNFLGNYKFQNFWLFAIAFVYLFQLIMFWRFYTKNYPIRYSHEWQAGYAEMIVTVGELADENKDVYITRQQGRPAMYYWFYTQTDPKLVQMADESSKQDQGEYLEFANVKFVGSLFEVGQSGGVVAASPKEIDEVTTKGERLFKIHKEISNFAGNTIWLVGELQ